MEIHIQLAGVELGPYSERQVRDYLAEDLLSLTDPARLEGSPAWETVGDALGKLKAPAAPAPVTPVKPAPVAIPPQGTVSAPLPNPEIRKSPLVTTAPLSSNNSKSRDTIRVPLPQIAEALARQTSQGVRKAIPAPTATGQTKSSEKARTSLLTAVSLLAKKSDPNAKAVPAADTPEVETASRPQTVPVTFPKSAESFRTMPMPMGKTTAKKPDLDEKPKHPEQPPAPALIRKPESTGASAKALDPKRTSLLSPVRILPRKPEPAEPSSVSTVAPQTLRTAPMSMVRALPKKTEPWAKAPPEAPPAGTGLIPIEPPPPPDTVRFIPSESVPESEKTAKVPPASPDTLFLKKSLHRTTGSLPALVKALAEKPEGEEVPTEVPVPAETEATPESASEVIAEEPPSTSSPAPSWIRALAQKIGFWKSGEPSLPGESTEIPQPENETTEPVVEKEEPVAGKFKPLTRLPAPETKPLESISSIPQPLTRLPVAPEDLEESEAPPQEPAAKIPRPLTQLPESTNRLPAAREKPLAPITRQLKPLTRLPEPDEKLSEFEGKPLTKQLKPLTRLPESPEILEESEVGSTEETLESSDPEVSSKPTRLPRGVIIGLVVLVVLVGITAIVLSYVRASSVAAGTLLEALKFGKQAELEKVVDFPAVRQALKDEVAAQLGKSGSSPGNSDPTVVLAMIKNSIDYYVTPEMISALAAKPDSLPKTGPGPTLQPSSAAAILAGLNALPVKSQSLVSYNLYVIDLDVAKLDLQSGASGWKLNRIELKANFSMPTDGGGTAAPEDLSTSLAVPVIETYFNEGKAKFQAGDWDGAIAEFSQVLSLDPKQVVAYSNRGMAKSKKADFDGAIADFTQAVSLDPRLAEAFYNRGDAKAAKNDTDGAVADYTQATNLDPKLGMAFYKRGGIRTLKGDYEGAIADFTQDIAVDPNFANAYNNRGYVRRAQNDLDGAIADFTQALAINPKIAGAYYNRALAKEAKADLDGAIIDYNHALDLDPKMTRAYYNRGIAKNTKNDLDGALADYNQALTLDPKLAPALSDRALIKQAKGDLQGALDDFNQALTIDPKLADAYYSRGLIKEQLNDLDGAISDSSRAIDLDPKRAQPYYNRGFAKLVKGNLEGSRADLLKFCEIAPRDPYAAHARLYLWLISMAQNPTGTANQDLSDALQNSWSLGSDDLVTKIALFLLDRTTETDLIAAAASSNPKKEQGQDCEVWYFAGMKRLLAGDKATAIDYFHKCLETGQRDYCEYILAQAELQVLAPNP
jgi:tetratricopeptide (TPR) repeat protein